MQKKMKKKGKNTMLPNIFKETSNGYFHFTLLEEFLSKREIYCLGDINAESANSLILQLKYLEQEDSQAEITLYINSPGGGVSDGLAIYDVMKTISCPIRTVCIGRAASMGALLFAAGDTREIYPHSKVMIHDPLVAGNGLQGSASLVHSQAQSLMKTRAIIAEILARHTGQTLKQIYKKTSSDTWFTAEEAVAFGLADAIIISAH